MTAGIGRSGWDDFVDIWKKFRSVTVIALGSGATVPLAAHLTNILPPWPPGAVLITALVEFVTFVLVFQFLRTKGRQRIDRFLKISAPSLFVLSGIYLLLTAMFTYEWPNGKGRSATGFICQTKLPQQTLAECPVVGRERIRDAEYTAELIWQEWTIRVMRFTLAMVWLGSFMLLSAVIGAFLVFQTKVRSRGRTSTFSPPV